jgi:protein TonB
MKRAAYGFALTVLGLIALVQAQVHPAQRVRVSEGYAETLVIRKVQPTYPTEARKKHVQGKLIMQAEISKEGTVQFIKVLSGDSLLTEAASAAVKQWKYKPYLLNGEPYCDGNASHRKFCARQQVAGTHTVLMYDKAIRCALTFPCS